MLPVNKINHCISMLQSRSFLSEKNFRKESTWLICYLKKQKMSIDEIYNIWKEMMLKLDPDYEETGLLQRTFDLLCAGAKRVRLGSMRSVIIFQEEIDAINAVFLPLWVKRFLLTLYVCCKIRGKSVIDEDCFDMFDEIIHLCGKQRVRLEEKEFLINRLEQAGLLKCNNSEYTDSFGDIMVTLNYSFAFARDDGIVGFSIFTPYDLPEFYSMLKNEFKCERCGKMFEKSSWGKSNLCKECKEQLEKERSARRTSIVRKPEVIVVCPECNREFTKTGNNKTDLCPECEAKKRSKPSTIAFCSACGGEFIKTSKSQTGLCQECWKKDLRKRNLEAVKRYAQNRNS